MATPLALVVDDSRMARHVLSKMLKEQGIEVDTVESGEEALGYLCSKKPSMIFMDHTMPGMDGFQTLRAIKNDPLTTSIPIIMYTSKEGEVYESQARALGAVGVLPKTSLKPLELVNVLSKQNLLPGQTPPAAPAKAQPAPPDVVIVEAVEDQAAEAGTVDEAEQAVHHHNHQNELHELEQRLQQLTEQLQSINVAEREVPRRRLPLHYGVLAACVALIGVLMFYNARISSQIQDIRLENSRLQQALQARVAPTAAAQAPAATTSQPQPAPRAVSAQANRRLYENMEWALNQDGQFGYGERPFGDRLASALGRLGEDLAELGFKGEIVVQSHLGRFCTLTADTGETVLPEDGQPLSSCEVMEFDLSNVDTLGVEQTAGFASFVQSFEREHGDDIRLVLTTAGDRRPLVRYPTPDPDMEASRWNMVAARNQRIEVSINPDQP